MARAKIKCFVSYAHADDAYVKPFMAALTEMLKPSKTYDFELWRDTGILPGENWLHEIEAALGTCSLGLLLVSPAFLGSEFITSKEISRFTGDNAKPVIPVMLKKVNFDRHDLKGLEATQIYQYHAGPNIYHSFAQCGSKQKAEFIYDLHENIEKRLEKLA